MNGRSNSGSQLLRLLCGPSGGRATQQVKWRGGEIGATEKPEMEGAVA